MDTSRAEIPVAYALTTLPPRRQSLVRVVKTVLCAKGRYPAAAEVSPVSGNVVVVLTAHSDGSLHDVKLHQPSGSEILDQEAKDLVEQFLPSVMRNFQDEAPIRLLIPLAYRFEFAASSRSYSPRE